MLKKGNGTKFVNWFNVICYRNNVCDYKSVRSEIKFNSAKAKGDSNITNHCPWKISLFITRITDSLWQKVYNYLNPFDNNTILKFKFIKKIGLNWFIAMNLTLIYYRSWGRKDCICEPSGPNCSEFNIVLTLSHCKRGFSYNMIVQSFCGQASWQRNPRKGRLQKQVTWNT